MKIGINIHPTAMSKRRVYRVLRGGSYISDTGGLRASGRYRSEPEIRSRNDGFRIVIKRVKAQK